MLQMKVQTKTKKCTDSEMGDLNPPSRSQNAFAQNDMEKRHTTTRYNEFRKLPVEVRRIIWKFAVVNTREMSYLAYIYEKLGNKANRMPTMRQPSVIAAVRPDEDLYWEVLEAYYAINMIFLNNYTMDHFLGMSAEALLLIKKLTIEGV